MVTDVISDETVENRTEFAVAEPDLPPAAANNVE